MKVMRVPSGSGRIEQIKKLFGNKCEVISSFEKDGIHQQREGWAEALVDILKRRALTLDDISKITGVASSRIIEQLRDMEKMA